MLHLLAGQCGDCPVAWGNIEETVFTTIKEKAQ